MKNTNIFIGGVGGQGLVLMTKILSEAALLAGFDVKTNDIVGLSQRGGKIWGTVKFGEKVYSPNISTGYADYIVGLEPLEAYRWIHLLKSKGGIAIINSKRIYPTMVTMEQMEYPEDIESDFRKKSTLTMFDATEAAKEIGNSKMSNTILIGTLAKTLDLDKEAIIQSIKNNAPPKALELNIKAFEYGFQK